jgi:hypothetical protein
LTNFINELKNVQLDISNVRFIEDQTVAAEELTAKLKAFNAKISGFIEI